MDWTSTGIIYYLLMLYGSFSSDFHCVYLIDFMVNILVDQTLSISSASVFKLETDSCE